MDSDEVRGEWLSEGDTAVAERPVFALMEVDDSNLGRFPTHAPPTEEPDWMPGVLELELKNGLWDSFLSPESIPLGELEIPPDSALGTVHQFLLQSFPTARLQLSLMTEASGGRFITLYLPDETNVIALSAALNQFEIVTRAVPVPKSAPPNTPLDEPFLTKTDLLEMVAKGIENQWYIPRCRVDKVWELYQVSGNGVIISDIDWGFLTAHQEFQDTIKLTFNSIDKSTMVSAGDEVGLSHGTAVLGLAGADDNGLGMAGFAFGATFWAIRAEDYTHQAAPASWVEAINFVRTTDGEGKRKVIILEVQTSKGGNYEMVPSVNQTIKEAIQDGIVVCVAAGNGNCDAGVDQWGGTIPPTGSILVGATDYHPHENRRAAYSNWGDRVVVSAPGDLMHDVTCSSKAKFGYRNRFGGTSGATPKVAGTVALMLEANPQLSHEEIKEILRKTGSPVVTDEDKPVGTFLNAERAVSEARALAEPA